MLIIIIFHIHSKVINNCLLLNIFIACLLLSWRSLLTRKSLLVPDTKQEFGKSGRKKWVLPSVQIFAPLNDHSRLSREKFHFCCCLYLRGLSPRSQGYWERGCRLWLCWSLQVDPSLAHSLSAPSPLTPHPQAFCTPTPGSHVPFSASLSAALNPTFSSRSILSPKPSLPFLPHPQRWVSVLEDPRALAVCLIQSVLRTAASLGKARLEGAQILRTWVADCSGLGVPGRCLREPP